jgi:hypothetical protein
MKKLLFTSFACLQAVLLMASGRSGINPGPQIKGPLSAPAITPSYEKAMNNKPKGWILVGAEDGNYPSPYILPVPKGKYIPVEMSAPEK